MEYAAPAPRARALDRHYAVLAAAVLALGLFNLTFRLGQEAVAEWDESLYATTAWEAVTEGHWIGTTFQGELDYYNSKPPLNVWLIALAFKAFGVSLISLRLASVASAFLTILVLQRWTRRHFGPATALFASLILATTFGFFNIHSGRTANTDPLYTLCMLLTAVTLVAEVQRPWRRVWLGPVLAATFLLRGMAVLMPLAIVLVADLVSRRTGPRRWAPSAGAGLLFLLPAGAWAIARYRLDQWEFFRRMVGYDFVGSIVQPLEGHTGGPLFYLNVLHRNHFDWLAAGIIALLLAPPRWSRIRAAWSTCRDDRVHVVLGAWAVVALAVPTLMRTKLPWYLNSFYPVFAIGTAVLVSNAVTYAMARPAPRRRLLALAVGLAIVVSAAEARLLWYSFRYRDLKFTGQGLILAERQQLKGRRVFQDGYRRASMFVAGAMAGADPQAQPIDPCCGLTEIAPGDFLLTATAVSADELELVRFNDVRWLYRRRHDLPHEFASNRAARPVAGPILRKAAPVASPAFAGIVEDRPLAQRVEQMRAPAHRRASQARVSLLQKRP